MLGIVGLIKFNSFILPVGKNRIWLSLFSHWQSNISNVKQQPVCNFKVSDTDFFSCFSRILALYFSHYWQLEGGLP